MKKSELKSLIQEVISESMADAIEWERASKTVGGTIKSKWSDQRLSEINKELKVLEVEKSIFENPTPQSLMKWARSHSEEVERLVNSPRWRHENPKLVPLFDRSLNEGEEEKLGSSAYDREGAIESGKKIKCQCGKQFVPAYGEYKRCPSCLSKQHIDGERATGVEENDEYDKYHSGMKSHLDAKTAKGNVYGSDRISGGTEDKADLAKMSPEDQKKALNCLKLFQMSNQHKNVPNNKIIDAANDLEAINKKYGTDVGNVTRK